MSMKMLKTALLGLVTLALGTGSAQAVTDGDLDGNGHPYVGLMVAQTAKGQPLWRCSGTLLSPTIFLTAGHCTEAPAEHVEIWFDADVESGIPDNGYPYRGDAGGKPYTHPQFDPNAFFLYDLGVVVLKKPIYMSKYGKLPTLDVLDKLVSQRGLQDVTFTSVGYGLQEINPVFVESEPSALKFNSPPLCANSKSPARVSTPASRPTNSRHSSTNSAGPMSGPAAFSAVTASATPGLRRSRTRATAKLTRSTSVPPSIHSLPVCQPSTLGGSYRAWPITWQE